MSPRPTALAVAVILLAASGCFLIALYYAPLPGSWNLLLAASLALTALFWISLVSGIALALVLAVQSVTRRFADRNAKPS